MRARVPSSIIDNEYENFPEGFFDGNISAAEQRTPVADRDWTVIDLTLTDITPWNGYDTEGRNTFNASITVRSDGVEVFEVENFRNPDIPFGVRRAGGLLAGLAEGLKVASREDDGSIDVDLQAVANALTSGEFEGERVSFGVSHYKPKNSDTVYEQFERFGPASS